MKILSIIQARMSSTRLPGKVLLNIGGKSILQHIVDSLKYSQLTNKIIIATTTLPNDDKIENLARNIGINCFRGSSEDVLERYYKCAKSYQGDIIVRVTADNPLINPSLIDEGIRLCLETGCDYATNAIHRTYPDGYYCEVFTFSILKKLYETQKDKMSREHVTYHIRQNPDLYKIQDLFAPVELARPNWRLTVDYDEDLSLMREIFRRLYKPNSYIEYKDLVNLLDNNKDLLEINKKYQLKDHTT